MATDRNELMSERRMSDRARTEFGVVVRDGLRSEDARCVEVSGAGLLLARPGQTTTDGAVLPNDSVLTRLELRLPERRRELHAWARPVWARGSLMAYRIVQMRDVDRLSFAEHRDIIHRREQRG
jgi:hypothetical protein